MNKYQNILKNVILSLIIFSIAGCSHLNPSFERNRQLYDEYISSSETQYYYADIIIEKFPELREYESYQFFKIILSLKTEPFDKNIEIIKKTKNKKLKINGFIQGANKYTTLERPDLSEKFLILAQNELDSLLDKEQSIDFQTAVLINQLLTASLKADNYVFFEKICLDLIEKSKKNFYRHYELRPLIIPVKKYIISSFRKNKKFSSEILFFAEAIAWQMKPDNIIKIPEPDFSPYQFEEKRSAFFNPQRQRALSLIQLAEIYSGIDKSEEIYPIYLELVNIWKNSQENPHQGKSFELYIPGFVKLLFKEGYENEALYFISLIPEIFPYYIKNDYKAKRQTILYHQFQLREYNKRGGFHKYRCFKNIALLINSKKGTDYAVQWISQNIDNKKTRLKLYSDLSYVEKHKNNAAIDKISKFIPLYEKQKITADLLKNLYIPVLVNFYFTDKTKGDMFLLQITDKISILSGEERPQLFMKLARSILKVNSQKSIELCKKSFLELFSINEQDTVEAIKNIQLVTKTIGSSNFNCITRQELFSYSEKLIENISIPGNKGRLFEVKIDCMFLMAELSNYLDDRQKTLEYLETAETYVQMLKNQELKNSFTINIFLKYADFNFYRNAFEISGQIVLDNYDKDYFIKKISAFFIYDKVNEKRWLLIDTDNDGTADLINPEACEKLLKLHLENHFK
ncbi:MAG: hypothetical protein H6681_04200 [Desulfobacteraceae bacterium]|nr:hypothetical protein [Desulfobacteraceae bacterium]